MPGQHIVVSGGGGFLGRYLIQTLVRRRVLCGGQAIKSIAILDAGQDTEAKCDTTIKVFPNAPLPPHKINISTWTGDINDRALVQEVLKPKEAGQGVTVFHLASIMSAQGEQQFDKCYSVNVDGTRTLLEACRDVTRVCPEPVRVVFPSSIAAFGAQKEVHDESRLLPCSTYGTSKAMIELLLNDYTRKGYVNGRTGRLPTVLVRPGRGNMAATVCYSALVRELLQGNSFVIPVDPSHPHPVCSVETLTKGMITLAEAPCELLGHDRTVNFPSLTVTADELSFHTQQIAMARGIPLGEVSVRQDANTNRIIKSMPSVMEAHRARRVLHMKGDASIEAIITAYVDEFLSDEMDNYPTLLSS